MCRRSQSERLGKGDYTRVIRGIDINGECTRRRCYQVVPVMVGEIEMRIAGRRVGTSKIKRRSSQMRLLDPIGQWSEAICREALADRIVSLVSTSSISVLKQTFNPLRNLLQVARPRVLHVIVSMDSSRQFAGMDL